MIFASPFVECFSNPDIDLIVLLRNLIRNEYAPVLVAPGTKIPICPLTSKSVQQADEEAKEKAKEEGNPRWDKAKHACGFSHVLTKEDVPKLPSILSRLGKRWQGNLNVALNIGKSRFLVVDVDTPEQKTAFFEEWAEATGTTIGEKDLTVSSPGVIEIKDGNEVHKHKDGGHIYFHITDDVVLPSNIQSYTSESGWVAKWGNSIVLTPGSERKEGKYKLVGRPELEVPQWMADVINNEGAARAEEHRLKKEQWESREMTALDSAVFDWNDSVSWDDLLLEEDGWEISGYDSCGCPIYHLDGRASTKTATASDSDCFGKDLPVPGLLHFWTDAAPDFLPEGTKNITKFKYIVHRHYNGRRDMAINDLGITPEEADSGQEIVALNPNPMPEPKPEPKPDVTAILRNSGPKLMWGNEIPMKKQEWLWKSRIPMETFTLITGAGGVGKTTFIAWLDAQITCGTLNGDLYGTPGNVLYISHEDVPGTAIIPRHVAAGADLSKFMTVVANAEQFALPQGANKLKEVILKNNIKLVIVDPILSFMNIQSENSKLDVRSALNPLNSILQETRAAGIGIHHPNKATTQSLEHRAAGSGAFNELARSSLAVLLDKNTGLRYVGVYKTNLGAVVDSSARFKLEVVDVPITELDDAGRVIGHDTTTASKFEYYNTAYVDINRVYHVLQRAEADRRAEDRDLSILDRSVEDAMFEVCKNEIMLSGDLRLGNSTPGRVTEEKMLALIRKRFNVDDKSILEVLGNDEFESEDEYDSQSDEVTTYYTLKRDSGD